jgi:hypothetical protein
VFALTYTLSKSQLAGKCISFMVTNYLRWSPFRTAL